MLTRNIALGIGSTLLLAVAACSSPPVDTSQYGGSKKSARARDSYGVGLSVILQLLDQVGGLLEVQSAPGKGTTFWAHFPTRLDASGSDARIQIDSSEQIVSNDPLSSRVRIRKPPA